jgi:hypothetical protein
MRSCKSRSWRSFSSKLSRHLRSIELTREAVTNMAAGQQALQRRYHEAPDQHKKQKQLTGVFRQLLLLLLLLIGLVLPGPSLLYGPTLLLHSHPEQKPQER